MFTLNMLKAAAALSDEALVTRLKLLAGREREATVELDTRRVHVAEGYSLFTYCTEVLHLSEHAAYGRIEVARAVRRFPVILDRLADGSVNNSTVGLVARHLTPENHVEVLAKARHLTKPQVEMLVAHLAPRPDVPATIRKLPAPGPPTATTVKAPNSVWTELAAAPPVSPVARPVVVPLSPDRYRVQFTVGGETHSVWTEFRIEGRDPATFPLHTRHGQARGLGTGQWPMCVRGPERPAVHRKGVSGVTP